MQIPTKYKNQSFSAGSSPDLVQYTCQDSLINIYYSSVKYS